MVYRHADPPTPESLERVKRELRACGAVAYDLWLPETHHLPHVLHPDEHIEGVVYGRYPPEGDQPAGRAALIATDQRILFLNKKPGYVRCDELTFLIVGGVTLGRTLLASFVTLHSRLGDFRLRTFNQKAANIFVDYVEAKCLQEGIQPGAKYDAVT